MMNNTTTRFWRIDGGAGTVGCPCEKEDNIQEIECVFRPGYHQIEHDVSLMSFLTWEDIKVIDEVNSQKGNFMKAVLCLEVGESYHDSENNVTVVKL